MANRFGDQEATQSGVNRFGDTGSAPELPGFGQRVYQQTLQQPVELAKGLWNDPKGTLIKTLASMTATQLEAARNPVQVQPGLATPIIEDVRSGNLRGLAGDVTGLALDVFAPKILSKAPGAARVAGAGVRAAAPDVAAGAAKVGAGYVMEHILPGAGYLKYAVELPTAYSGAKQIGRGLKKGVAASREALNARALRAAEALAAERAAAEQAAAAARPQPIPEARRIEPPPDTSYVRAVPAEPLPLSRQLPPPGRPPIVTPAPDPLAGDTSGVRAVPAVYGSSAVNEAAAGVREAMGLQPGELTPPATRTAPVTARASQIDAMARHMRQAGITAEQATLLDPPDIAALANAAGIEGPLGKVAVRVRKRIAAMQKAEAETAKYQAAYDKLKPAEKAAVRGESEPGAAPAATEAPAQLSPAEALKQEMGYQPPETAAPKPVLSASERRIAGLAEMFAADELPTDKLAAGLESDANARLYLEQRSKDLGYGSPGPGEIPKILDKVRELRGESGKIGEVTPIESLPMEQFQTQGPPKAATHEPRIPANIAAEVRDLIRNSDYDVHGLRIVTDAKKLDPRLRGPKALKVGQEAPASWEWKDGMPTRKRLPGASAVKVDEYAVSHSDADLAARIEKGLKQVEGYTGGQLVLLGTKERFWPGGDPSELVMQRPIVIGSWQLGPPKK